MRGVNSKMVVNMIKDQGVKDVYYTGNLKNTAKMILPSIKDDDILITIGAGDIWQVSDEIYKEYHGSRKIK